MQRLVCFCGIVLSLLSSACNEPATLQNIPSTGGVESFRGLLASDAQLEPIVRLKDSTTTISIWLNRAQTGPQARVELSGEIELFFVQWHTFGDFTHTVRDLTLEQTQMRGSIPFEVDLPAMSDPVELTLQVTGQFESDGEELFVQVDPLGSILLSKQETGS